MKKIYLKRDCSRIFSIVPIFIGCVQLIFGANFLIPPILCSMLFTLNVLGVYGDIVALDNLGYNWTGGNAGMSAAPIYLGLMAIAGSFMVHSAVKNFIAMHKSDTGMDGITCIEITEKDKV